MPKFIDFVVDDLIKTQANLAQVTIVVPGKRPIVFFKKAFINHAKNTILPRFVSIEDWLEEVADLQKINPLKTWFTAYGIYQKQNHNTDSFAEFIKWFPTLLNDFTDLDSAMVNSKEVFDYLISVERIEKWNLTPEKANNNKLIKQHLLFWEVARDLYNQLNLELSANKQAYNGMIFRFAANQINHYLNQSNEHFVWVGFNALTKAEQDILSCLESKKRTTTYWHTDAYYMNNLAQEAGLFLREQQKKQPNLKWINHDFVQAKNIYSIACPNNIAQAKYAGNLLNKIPANELEDTAVVLADENLLPAVLNSLPNNISKANVTMGVKMSNIPIYSWFLSYFDLHINRENIGKHTAFYHQDLIAVLKQQQLRISVQDKINDFINHITNSNQIFIDANSIKNRFKDSFLYDWFVIPNNAKQAIDCLLNSIDTILTEAETDTINKEYLVKLHALLTNLYNELAEFNTDIDYKTLKFLFATLLRNETLSFVGEPLQGLQITGLLETRLINFKNLIICSVNEGAIPLGRIENSLIPYDIKKQFKLKTYTDSDAIFAYHFYRLLQDSNNVHLIYNTKTEGLLSGEKSRFIRQLELESEHPIQNINASVAFTDTNKPLSIPKTKTVVSQLERWKAKGVSASALKSYLRNPIEFYQSKILKVNTIKNELDDTVTAISFGNIVHECLQDLYMAHTNTVLTANILNQLIKQSNALVKEKFQTEFGKFYNQGSNLMAMSAANKMVQSVMYNDLETIKNNELIIRALEEKISIKIPSKTHENITLYGILDRVDTLNGMPRVIDYKTGGFVGGELDKTSDNLMQVFTDPKHEKAMQLLFYTQLFFNHYHDDACIVGIQSLRYAKLGLAAFNYNKKQIITKTESQEFTPYILDLIDEIINPNTPFTEPQAPNNHEN